MSNLLRKWSRLIFVYEDAFYPCIGRRWQLQNCIPAGYVPPACRPYPIVSHVGGGWVFTHP